MLLVCVAFSRANNLPGSALIPNFNGNMDSREREVFASTHESGWLLRQNFDHHGIAAEYVLFLGAAHHQHTAKRVDQLMDPVRDFL